MTKSERDHMLTNTLHLIELEKRKLSTMQDLVKALSSHLASDEIPLGPYPQRADYMDRQVSHETYYRSIAYAAGIDRRDMLPRVQAALAKGDKHLNTIPLVLWDTLSEPLSPRLRHAFKLHGDHFSLAGGVCAHKQAALMSAGG